ncbi:PD-(D/E)XK nuclease family protein [Candidatus Woesearchaeota archaeon]|nr:PD-(D/E)XK nuclease family protein [Candidatus Woesearchaeota archaeon]
MPVYSHSRLSAFEQCPLKFKFAYIDKVEVAGQSIEAFMGSIVHDVLEKLYENVKMQKIPSIKTLLAYYDAIWKKNWNENIIIVKKDYTQQDYKKVGEVCIINYYNKYSPFDQDTTLATEKRIMIDVGDDKKLQGYIDRLSSKDGVYEVHDYKTSSSLPLQEQVDTDRQLALYTIAVREGFKDAKQVKLVWHYLSFNKEIVSSRTDKQLEELKKETAKLIDKIEATKEFNPIVSKLCDYCEFREICPKWSHLAKLEDKDVKEFKKDEGVKLVDRFALLKQEIKDREIELDDVKEAIINYCKQFGISVVFGSDNKVSWAEVDSVKIPAKGSEEREKLVNVLKEFRKFSEVSDLDVHALKKTIEEGKWDKELLNKVKKLISVEKSERLHLGKKEED